jgi:hypothetical protein
MIIFRFFKIMCIFNFNLSVPGHRLASGYHARITASLYELNKIK